MADPLGSYPGSAQRFDELLDRNGAVRAHWLPLIEHLTQSGAEAVRRGVELARRLVVENGVTYNVYADPQGKDRPWLLDPLPLLLSGEEWQRIEAGVVQRARVMNALLCDLYGPQKLLQSGVLPAELAYGHPNYLWAAQGVRPLGGTWLHLHAVDLARAPDGRWWALGDRTQAPSGPGYTLENRQIVGRVFPGLMDEMGVRPLHGFMNALREQLLGWSGERTPLAVVLTPGPFNETYFEHAYLARQLGFPLVQGQDLTVRDDTVYMKTLAGLKRVHAILRRLDDDYCDPLELRADSALGVPGLLGAVRAGRVVLANGLGSGVLESAAWQGFLPGAARALLGEELSLPPVATWWCGEKPALDYVLANLDRLVVKGSFPNQRFEAVFGRNLDDAGAAQVRAKLRARPYAYCAQERILLSQAPVWRAANSVRLAPRALTLRVYAIATAGGYRVLPGGLARIAAEGVSDVVSSQRGGGSKDVWVLPGPQDSLPLPEPAAPPRRVRHDELPSQLVESLYWLGRYSERCEDKTRLLRASLSMRTDRLVWPTARAECVHQGVLAASGDPALGLYDEQLEFGLAADLGRFGWSATQARSRLSAAHWRSITLMQRQFHEAGMSRAEPVEALDRLLVSLTALAGFALDDMTQDDGWRLLMIGRHLERVQFMARLVARALRAPSAPLRGQLGWLLDCCSSSITYRTRYLATPQLRPALELLVRDDINPRALNYQWTALQSALAELGRAVGAGAELPEASPLRPDAIVLDDVERADAAGAAARGRVALQLEQLETLAGRVSDRLSLRHFSHVAADRHVVAT